MSCFVSWWNWIHPLELGATMRVFWIYMMDSLKYVSRAEVVDDLLFARDFVGVVLYLFLDKTQSIYYHWYGWGGDLFGVEGQTCRWADKFVSSCPWSQIFLALSVSISMFIVFVFIFDVIVLIDYPVAFMWGSILFWPLLSIHKLDGLLFLAVCYIHSALSWCCLSTSCFSGNWFSHTGLE